MTVFDKSGPVTTGWSPPKDTKLRRRLLYARYLLKRALLIRGSSDLSTLGNVSTVCSWTFCTKGLTRDSIVYSGGVGNDISFEHALVREFGCDVKLFDPSTTALATMSRFENKIPQFSFFTVGLTGRSRKLRLAPPLDAQEGSWYSSEAAGAVEVPCIDLGTLLKQNHDQQIDLLKLDIEGAEYGVLDDILRDRIPVRQILVEFHDGILPGIRLRDSLRVIFRLIARGYRLVAEVGNNHTFIYRS